MDKYAVFGNPVKHSLSPKIHQLFAKQTQQKFHYEKIEPPIDEFESTLRNFIASGGKGCNISFPFKYRAFLFADKKSDAAQTAQAASCLAIQKDQTILAENYDGTGLVQDLTNNHHYSLNQKKILILGAGGATQGILSPLLAKAPSIVILANRNAQKAIDMAHSFQSEGAIQGIGLEQIEAKPFDLIIHATTIGHQGKILSLPNEIITKNTRCYDLSYGSAAKPFLKWAKIQGAKEIFDGLGMLIEHNAALFYLWRNVRPDTKPVIQLLQVKN